MQRILVLQEEANGQTKKLKDAMDIMEKCITLLGGSIDF
jgi:hypothetical protein